MQETNIIEIILLLAVAIFIVIKLRSTLGKVGEEDQQFASEIQKRLIAVQQAAEKAQQEEEEVIIQNNADDEFDNLADGDIKNTITEIKNQFADFNLSQFNAGARGAYEMVIESLAKNDISDIEGFLGEDVKKSFKKHIDNNAKADSYQAAVLISVAKNDIIEISKLDNTVIATVHFVTEQMRTIVSKDGSEPKKASSIENIEEQWVFSRNLTSQSPAWLIVGIK